MGGSQPHKEGPIADSAKTSGVDVNVTVTPEDGKSETVQNTSTYSVPANLSEGLENPAFVSSQETKENVQRNPEIEGKPVQSSDTLEPPANVPANPSFTSLSSYEQQYASQTMLYCKDKRGDDEKYDAEKGKPCEKDESSSDTKKKGKDKEYTGLKKYLGLLLTLSASFCFSIVVLFVKVLKDYGFDAYGASFWRYTGTVIPTIPLIFFYECGPGTKKQDSIFTSVWPVFKNENWKTWIGLLVRMLFVFLRMIFSISVYLKVCFFLMNFKSRGIIGSTSVILRYYALQYLTIGDTSVITYSTPVLVTVLAHFFLGERCGVFPIIIAMVTLCGVIIVTKPPILTGATEFDANTLVRPNLITLH